MFIYGCVTCKWAKNSTAAPPGELAPLLIPSEHFACWLLDFITCLPIDHGFNAVLVCVDKLSKLVCLVPCATREGELSAKATA